MHFSHLTGVLARKVETEVAASALVITAAKSQTGFIFVSSCFFFFFHFFNIWVGSWVRGPLHTTMDYHVPLTFKCSEQLHPNVSVHGVYTRTFWVQFVLVIKVGSKAMLTPPAII